MTSEVRAFLSITAVDVKADNDRLAYDNARLKKNGQTGDEYFPDGRLKKNGVSGEEFFADGRVAKLSHNNQPLPKNDDDDDD